jgi:3-deoxy-D-manno-octulosonic acid (KDO) 8-phosphate synthase
MATPKSRSTSDEFERIFLVRGGECFFVLIRLLELIVGLSSLKDRSKFCSFVTFDQEHSAHSPNDAWLRFSGSLKVQKNIFTLAAISLVQASMFLEPDWARAKRQGQ